MAAIDRNCRLIKGQVFLSKAGQAWEDLWEMQGEITTRYNLRPYRQTGRTEFPDARDART